MNPPPKLAEVKTLYESNPRDIVKTLRLIADQMEQGQYGDVGEAAIVVKAHDLPLDVFGLGQCDGASIHLMLHAAMLKLGRALL